MVFKMHPAIYVFLGDLLQMVLKLYHQKIQGLPSLVLAM